MVAPAATNLEVARRIALLAEPAGRNQRDGGHIVGLDVGLKAMKLEHLERVAHHGLKPLLHETLTLMPHEGVIAQVAALKQPADDVGQIDDADDCLVVLSADEEGVVRRRRHALDVGAKLGGSIGRTHPRTMEDPALADGSQERLHVGKDGLADEYPDFHCAPTAQGLGGAVRHPIEAQRWAPPLFPCTIDHGELRLALRLGDPHE